LAVRHSGHLGRFVAGFIGTFALLPQPLIELVDPLLAIAWGMIAHE
jgi:hypothetical protein